MAVVIPIIIRPGVPSLESKSRTVSNLEDMTNLALGDGISALDINMNMSFEYEQSRRQFSYVQNFIQDMTHLTNVRPR